MAERPKWFDQRATVHADMLTDETYRKKQEAVRYALQLERDLAAVTAERDRLRVQAIITTEWIENSGVDSTSLHFQLRAALTPPAEQRASDLTTQDGLVQSLTEVRDSLKAGDAEQPAPVTKACPKPTPDDIEFVVDHVGMGTGAWDMVNPAEIVEGAWLRLRSIDGSVRTGQEGG